MYSERRDPADGLTKQHVSTKTTLWNLMTTNQIARRPCVWASVANKSRVDGVSKVSDWHALFATDGGKENNYKPTRKVVMKVAQSRRTARTTETKEDMESKEDRGDDDDDNGDKEMKMTTTMMSAMVTLMITMMKTTTKK